MVVPYGYELPQDRAKTYAAAHCRYCLDMDQLTYDASTGDFTCEVCDRNPRRAIRSGRYPAAITASRPAWVEEGESFSGDRV